MGVGLQATHLTRQIFKRTSLTVQCFSTQCNALMMTMPSDKVIKSNHKHKRLTHERSITSLMSWFTDSFKRSSSWCCSHFGVMTPNQKVTWQDINIICCCCSFCLNKPRGLKKLLLLCYSIDAQRSRQYRYCTNFGIFLCTQLFTRAVFRPDMGF